MDKSEMVRFLQAIDEALAVDGNEGERLDLYLLGRSALIVRYGLSLATKDVDLVTRGEVPQLQARAFELFGKGTANALKWGLYLEGVPEGLPPVPGSYRRLSVELPGDWKVHRPKQLDPHDLAITKLKRFHTGDREDLRINWSLDGEEWKLFRPNVPVIEITCRMSPHADYLQQQDWQDIKTLCEQGFKPSDAAHLLTFPSSAAWSTGKWCARRRPWS